ncbi:hypothetical protein RHSIM_Rhsim06G0060200 [Rhododendron simsii]|uniref:DUF4283 domain-containing protein n=1 Tax=Rhododendron simsii TaxID=118357 RepID=A0A834GWW7_RHOSS|nr:hypothetical protein RHSIM_Rhsim06G0060200 [Rhododendron simsii]
MASFGKNFDALFPPLGLSSSTSASKFRFPGPHKSVSLLSNNSLHCGSVPILVNGFGTSVDNQGVSSSVGCVNLLDFLESVSDHLEIQNEFSVFSSYAGEGEDYSIPPSAVEALGAVKWKDFLVGRFVDKKIPFLAVRSVAFKKWADNGLVDVLSNDKGFYFFQFGSEGACRQIVESGPWHFGGRLMVLQIWHSDIEYEKEGLAKYLSGFSFIMFLSNFRLQSYIASSVGKPLYADEMAETAKGISYAKICVEVHVTASLPHSVDLLDASGKKVSIAIKHPWRPKKCDSCRVFGHSGCNQKVVQPHVSAVDIPAKGLNAPRGKVWVVKPGGRDSGPTPLEGFDPALIMVMGFEVTEVSLGYGDSVIQDSLVGAPNGSDPSSSKGMEMVQDDTLPDVLGVGMAYPDALFQALTSKEMENLHKPNEGKNPGAAKRGRKPKKQ